MIINSKTIISYLFFITKEMPYFKARLAVIVLMYNCVRPHWTLSKNPDKKYVPRTPALAANLIDKNWTIDSAFKKPLIL